ncbi:MAG: amidase [Candidatus Nanopelagicales bacterium]|nr:amidase [Candidatus Nanopelagicales bacterium]
MAQLHDLSALEQGRAIAAGQVSSVELTKHYLERSARLDEQVGAFAIRTPELALEQARAADAQGGRIGLSPLHGVVIPPKDLDAWAGVRCRLGSAAFDFVPEVDDHVVVRMQESGFVFTGKTSAPEFGLPAYTEPEVAPPSRTPWDLTRTAGGSSGGAAAAVAAGLVSAAVGSDGGGSIRIPASCCGLVGIKPSRGRVSNGPGGEGIGELGVQGPIARTVADAAAVLDALSVPFVGDPFVAPQLSRGSTFLGAAAVEPGRLRIGRFSTPIITPTPVAAECLQAFDEASALLERLGHTVVDIEVPFPADVFAYFEILWGVLTSAAELEPAQEAQLRPLTTWLRERGALVSGSLLARTVTDLRTMARTALQVMSDYDVILTPTLAQLPPLIGAMRNDADPAADFAAQCAFTPYTSPFNLTGQPAISLPLHWTSEGLPVGIQLVGRLFDESTLISLAAQLEAAQPWIARRPAVW